MEPDFESHPDNQVARQGERIASPELIIRAPSPDEEFDYLWRVLKRMPFYREHNITPALPENPKFQKLAGDSASFEAADKNKMRKLFITEIYTEDFYRAGLRRLEEGRERIESSFPVMESLQDKWGFKIFPQYSLILTKYGPGGSYNSNTGKVTMRTGEDGAFLREDPTHTAIHELVHIGIQGGIVKKYGMTHQEKERLVDLICMNCFKDIIPEYKARRSNEKRIDEFVSKESLDNLPEAMNRYVRKYPRD